MKRFVFFSKTMYDETPRIRHQLAELLISNGHEVVFYQKPLFFFESSGDLINKRINNKLQIRQTKQLVHHQLRVNSLISFFNSFYETSQIKKSSHDIIDSDVIINFNYDYSFLRDIFKKNKIITLINDDFVAQAKFSKGKHTLKALSKTLKTSNTVLTVSYPLIEQAKAFSNNVQLFLPWSKEEYSNPVQTERNAVLLWAHIDARIDFKLLDYLLNKNKSVFFHLVGPITNDSQIIINKLKNSHTNLVLYPSSSLDELPLDLYFASIIPYKSGVAEIEAVTASNKTFQLLSKGLPLITHGMPSFFEHKSIFKTASYEEFSKYILKAQEEFYNLQPEIERLVKSQQPINRYVQIMSIVNEN